MALAAQKDGKAHRVYCILGDGECDEGSVWEAALIAHQFRLDHLIAVVDHNKMQSLDFCENTLSLAPFGEKWQAFGWERDRGGRPRRGRASAGLAQTQANAGTKKPTVIIAHTIKGKGVSFMENNILWHYRTPRVRNTTRH